MENRLLSWRMTSFGWMFKEALFLEVTLELNSEGQEGAVWQRPWVTTNDGWVQKSQNTFLTISRHFITWRRMPWTEVTCVFHGQFHVQCDQLHSLFWWLRISVSFKGYRFSPLLNRPGNLSDNPEQVALGGCQLTSFWTRNLSWLFVGCWAVMPFLVD